jgi:hypothetical protein
MDEPTDLPGARWGHLRWLLLLVVVALALRAWQVWHTEVTTRDSIAFIRYAWRLESERWPEVVKSEKHHPLYPFLIHFVSRPVRAFFPGNLPRAMTLTTQLISSLASVLLVVPMYFVGCELFSRRVGFWATLLFQCLPGSGRILPDGISESVFLLLVATSTLCACRAMRAGGLGWFVLTGLTSGLSYLTRTEGLLVAAVSVVVLAGLQRSPTWQRSRPALARAGLVLAAATLIVAGPFMWLIGGLSNKPGVRIVLGGEQARKGETPPRDRPAHIVHAPLPLAAWSYANGKRPEDRYGWAAWALVLMVDKAFFHVLTLPFAVGLFLWWRRAARVPGMWVMLGVGAVLAALVYRLGQSNGYLGERHVQLILMGGLYWAVATLAFVCGWLGQLVGRQNGSALAFVLLTGVVALALPRTLAPLHSERVGFRLAGEWLAEHVEPGDMVFDPFTWSSYHAGLDFAPGRPVEPTSVCYVVLDRSRSKHDHLWYLVNPAEEQASKGVEVRRFPVCVGKSESTVIVYRVHLAPGVGKMLARNAGPAVCYCRGRGPARLEATGTGNREWQLPIGR